MNKYPTICSLSRIASVIFTNTMTTMRQNLNLNSAWAFCCHRLLCARCWWHHIFRTYHGIMGVPAPSLLGELHTRSTGRWKTPVTTIVQVRTLMFCLYMLCQGHKWSLCWCTVKSTQTCLYVWKEKHHWLQICKPTVMDSCYLWVNK